MSQSQVAESVHKTELHKGHLNVTRKRVGMWRESSTLPVCVPPVYKRERENERKRENE